MAPRGCVISSDNFCFICGEYTVKSQLRNISDFVKSLESGLLITDFYYFKSKLGDKDKPWAPHKVCRRCEEDIRLWFKAIRPVPHTSEIPVPHPLLSLDDIRSDSEDGDTLPHQD
ncbi:hypothetical protein AVEN_99570-1 [Araneus ventricosus]|uniref:Uncharacterized protein n=1 Tax=Araneus ventricosus TaxID=182803 RepID=A0A4Y2IC30_ARAVE|nr:hypothetical protein AVEN_99570-1 [Araneus ventricosus]